ncbi:MAG TPA: hypothetical protein VFR70_04490 [Flavobacterium sp.]|nr:hypothetical protein [Flavobacterium sp.]
MKKILQLLIFCGILLFSASAVSCRQDSHKEASGNANESQDASPGQNIGNNTDSTSVDASRPNPSNN